MYPELRTTLDALSSWHDPIPMDRMGRLDRIAAWLNERRAAGSTADLVFICTHNSRRSHLAQVWAATAAAYHDLQNVRTYSGGVEVTEMHLNIVDALMRQGFRVDGSEGPNPQYMVNLGNEIGPILCWSKTYDDPANPQRDFAAVMVCTDAEEACPFVAGAAVRFSLPYLDPKEADGTPEERNVYDQRSLEIACEMLHLFSRVK